MNSRGHTFGGNWTEQKLECVSKYLHSYTQIMKNRDFHFAYIDAFAGTGYRELKHNEDIEIPSFLAGSARKALEVKPPFREYVFIEEDKDSYTELKNLTDQFPNQSVFAMVADNPFPLRNSKNSLMYLLCFAAGNPNAPKALEIAEDILEKMQNRLQPTLPI